MVVCREDDYATPTDAIKAMGQIGEAVVSYREFENCDHCSFNFGKNQSFLKGEIERVNSINKWTAPNNFETTEN